MVKKRDEKKDKKGFFGFLFKIAVALAAVYLVFTFISGQLQVAAKQRELDDISAKVEQQAEKNQELLRMMEADNDDAYVERVAREKLGYARPHERVFVDLTGE